MRCPKCYSDNAYETGCRIVKKGHSCNIIKCWDCGNLFEQERSRKWQRSIGQRGGCLRDRADKGWYSGPALQEHQKRRSYHRIHDIHDREMSERSC